MKIAFFSDTHLGHRRFGRIDEHSGLNVRELDVMRTFERFLKAIEQEQPDVVLHGGDFFDMVRPSNHTILKAFSLMSQFQRTRSGAEFIAVAGNHELPRVQGTGCIISLLAEIPGVRVFWSQPEEVVIERNGERVSILCVPHHGATAAGEFTQRPDDADRRLLLCHGVVPGTPRVREADLDVEPFKKSCDLVLLGDYHVHHTEGKKVVYVGSTDYVSSNIWEEADHPKGWLLVDTGTMEWQFRKVEPVRSVCDLPPIDASSMGVTDVLDRMLRAMEELRETKVTSDRDLPIVRQRVLNAPEGFRREIPFDLLQTLRGMALDYALDIRSEERQEQEQGVPSESDRRTAEDLWAAFAREYEIPEEVDRERFVETGLTYLKEARDVAEAHSS
jgi:exonuclease SbcD